MSGQERKLFVAHILYRHRYEMWGRGRIEKPLALVRALINRGTVGPTTSIREDYSLLEAQGIVSVDVRSDGEVGLLYERGTHVGLRRAPSGLRTRTISARATAQWA